LADSLTLANNTSSNLKLTRTFFANIWPLALARWPSLEAEAAGFLPHMDGLGALGRRTETVVASPVVRDDTALMTMLSGRPALSREESAATAVASERFIYGPG
jgi:hypothetical protein